jgi:hypothetical protein
VFIGISSQSQGWEFYIPETHEVGVLSQNVVFYEGQLFKDWAKPQPPTKDASVGGSVPELDLWIDPFPTHLWSDPDVDEGVPSMVPSPEGKPGTPTPRMDPLSPMPGMSADSIPEAQPDMDQESPPVESALEAPISPSDVEHPVTSPTEEALPFALTPEEEVHIPPNDVDPEYSNDESDDSDDEDAPVAAGIDYVSIAPTGRPVRARGPPSFFTPTMSGKYHGTRGRALTAVSTVRAWRRKTGSAHRVQGPKWGEPTTLRQAEASDDAEQWRDARLEELGRMYDLHAWELVEPTDDMNILGSRWVFTTKRNPDGTLERYKARLVAQGFGQIEGVDFDQTFAPTAGMTSVRTFLAMVGLFGLHCHQLDVTTAFLYGLVDKDIYMRQPPGHSNGTEQVCKLRRSIYGLKQSPRIWQEKLASSLRKLGFEVSRLDPSLYILKKNGDTLLLLDFVDDLLLASSNMELIEGIKKALCKEYTMKDLGEATRYVGIKLFGNKAKCGFTKPPIVFRWQSGSGSETDRILRPRFPRILFYFTRGKACNRRKIRHHPIESWSTRLPSLLRIKICSNKLSAPSSLPLMRLASISHMPSDNSRRFVRNLVNDT